MNNGEINIENVDSQEIIQGEENEQDLQMQGDDQAYDGAEQYEQQDYDQEQDVEGNCEDEVDPQNQIFNA